MVIPVVVRTSGCTWGCQTWGMGWLAQQDEVITLTGSCLASQQELQNLCSSKARCPVPTATAITSSRLPTESVASYHSPLNVSQMAFNGTEASSSKDTQSRWPFPEAQSLRVELNNPPPSRFMLHESSWAEHITSTGQDGALEAAWKCHPASKALAPWRSRDAGAKGSQPGHIQQHQNHRIS